MVKVVPATSRTPANRSIAAPSLGRNGRSSRRRVVSRGKSSMAIRNPCESHSRSCRWRRRSVKGATPARATIQPERAKASRRRGRCLPLSKRPFESPRSESERRATRRAARLSRELALRTARPPEQPCGKSEPQSDLHHESLWRAALDGVRRRRYKERPKRHGAGEEAEERQKLTGAECHRALDGALSDVTVRRRWSAVK